MISGSPIFATKPANGKWKKIALAESSSITVTEAGLAVGAAVEFSLSVVFLPKEVPVCCDFFQFDV